MSKVVLISFLAMLLHAENTNKMPPLADFNARKARDQSEKFYKALDEFMSGNFNTAYMLFNRLYSDGSPKTGSDERGVALFNASLCLERQKKYKEAAQGFE
ncbi:MAG: hypothetical protein JXA66_04175, partial [Oligoflexia bacterium]|nr:hypothetical protein [Oligoflexia bacterium]